MSGIDEYTSLASAIAKLESELKREHTLQYELREQILEYYRVLKSTFAEYWPPLRERQVE